jgi:hypothetical protein
MNVHSQNGEHPGPRGVPDELMRRLRDATQQLSDARGFLEAVLDSPVGTLEQREKASARLREAEGQIERATDEVNRFLWPRREDSSEAKSSMKAHADDG